jgi:sugar (pentulose or hexulose) kinase
MADCSIVTGYLGIDNGTQGLSVLLTDKELNVIATGESLYDFLDGLEVGCYEQRCEDWDRALRHAMTILQEKLAPRTLSILAIGISGQMHGEVLVNQAGIPIQPVRLWCDVRNEQEGHELTAEFATKVPKRATVARFLWTVRNRLNAAIETAHITTPAGWLAYRLTGEFTLGIGDAAGMFPINVKTLDYDKEKLKRFDDFVNNKAVSSFVTLLPRIRRAGEDAGTLTESGAALLGISQTGIPVAAAEGDQVAALAGSLIGSSGTISCCFGTSVCANLVGDRPFLGVSPSVDHFCAADGKPINMVWLRNGTTFLNTIVHSYTSEKLTLLPEHVENNANTAFDRIMPLLIEAPDDCGGLLALPFMDDEPGLEIAQGGCAMIVGWNPTNSKVGNVAKAALLSTMFNLRLGCAVLDDQGFPRNEIVLSGGLSKTKECGQILSDIFNVPVTLLCSADEGCAWGATVLAKYRYLRATESVFDMEWSTFLESIAARSEKIRFFPNKKAVIAYNELFDRYNRLLETLPQLLHAVARE